MAFLVYCAVMFHLRRDRQPIASRDIYVVYFQLIVLMLTYWSVFGPNVNSYTATCGYSLWSAYMFMPVLLWTYIIRSFKLLFMYRLSEAKVRGENLEWYFKRRSILTYRASAVAIGVIVIFLLIL